MKWSCAECHGRGWIHGVEITATGKESGLERDCIGTRFCHCEAGRRKISAVQNHGESLFRRKKKDPEVEW